MIASRTPRARISVALILNGRAKAGPFYFDNTQFQLSRKRDIARIHFATLISLSALKPANLLNCGCGTETAQLIASMSKTEEVIAAKELSKESISKRPRQFNFGAIKQANGPELR